MLAPSLIASAVAFFLSSFILPKNPSAPVVFGLPSHSSSCLRSGANYAGEKSDSLCKRLECSLDNEVVGRVNVQRNQTLDELLRVAHLERVQLRQGELDRGGFLA